MHLHPHPNCHPTQDSLLQTNETKFGEFTQKKINWKDIGEFTESTGKLENCIQKEIKEGRKPRSSDRKDLFGRFPMSSNTHHYTTGLSDTLQLQQIISLPGLSLCFTATVFTSPGRNTQLATAKSLAHNSKTIGQGKMT